MHSMLKLQKFSIQKLAYALRQSRTMTAWGLDIGGHALKAVKIAQTADGLFVEDMDIIEYSVLSPDANSIQYPGIQETIQTFLLKHRITKTDKISISIPGQFVLSRFTSIPPVDKKQLRNLIRYEAKQQIPFDLNDIAWDYQQLTEQVPGMEGIEIGLFASKKEMLGQLLTSFSPLESRLTAIQPSPLAMYNFISFDQQTDGLAIILNSEAENTDIIIADDQYFWLRSIPVSTVDADLVKEIQRSVEYYKSLTKGTAIFKTLLLMGSQFNDPVNVKFITDNFAYETKVLHALNNVKLCDTINPVYFNEHILHLGVALGLALQGVGVGRIKTNLLPRELIKAAEIAKKKPYAIAALGCLGFSLIIQYSGLHTRITHLKNSDDHHQKVLQNVKELEREYRHAETLAQTKKSSLDLISSIDSSRFIWMEILDKVLSLIPDNVSIASIQSSWIDEDSISSGKQTSPAVSQPKKAATPAKPGASKKLLFMGIKGESQEPSMRFIEERVLKPIQNLTLFNQKVAAFKNVEIVPGSSRQVVHKEGLDSYISFEIRWIVKSKDEIRDDENALLLNKGTATQSRKL